MEKRTIELDGLRGFAALIVVIAHYFGEPAHGVEHLQIGWFGVEVFFVLSGYLIGGIILDERGRPDFFERFYLRRAARILPVYALTVLAVAGLAAMFAGSAWVEQPYALQVYAGFLQNMVPAATGHWDAVWTRQTWTLAVEEQFYLLLPFAILLTPRKLIAPLLVALIGGALVFRLACASNVDNLLLTLPGRSDLLSAGVLAAWAKRNLSLSAGAFQALRWAPGPLLIVTALIFLYGGPHQFALWGETFVAIGVACYILAIGLGAQDGGAVLRSRVLTFAGTISYAFYLMHQPINALLHGLLLGAKPDVGSAAEIAVTCAAFGLSVGAATLSWYMLERPILRWSKAFLETRQTRQPSFSGGLALEG